MQEGQQHTDASFSTVNGGLSSSIQSAEPGTLDYDQFITPARIVVYDDFKSSPQVIQVQGGATHDFIERIASITYTKAKEQGGSIPYTVIREASENFIHAEFSEVVVSILDGGNTIRFSDQGPGIQDKELAQQPGFTSATEPMKRYIRGVGSGFPIMNDYLNASHGYYTIEDNVGHGTVVTVSLMPPKPETAEGTFDSPSLTQNERVVLSTLSQEHSMGITELHQATGIAVSSIHSCLQKMEKAGLVEREGKKRLITQLGIEAVRNL